MVHAKSKDYNTPDGKWAACMTARQTNGDWEFILPAVTQATRSFFLLFYPP